MATHAKLLRAGDHDEVEKTVANALVEVENSVQELRVELKPLNLCTAKEVDVGSKKAVVMFVPVPQLKSYHKVQSRLVRELEKKFSGKHVVVVAQRKILKKPSRTRKLGQPRPRSRTLTAVHDSILEDLVFPSEIVGKRIRFRTDGSKVIKVFLDKSFEEAVEHKTETFSSVYKQLTGKDVTFEFQQVSSKPENKGKRGRN